MITITLLDEVNAHVGGIPKKHFKVIHESMKLPKKGAFMTVAYQMKLDDGMESLISNDGFIYQYFLDDLLDMLFELGYTDTQITIDDAREIHFEYDKKEVNDQYLKDVGIIFRNHQTMAVNAVINNRKGILDLATNAGKAQPLWAKVLTPDGWKNIGDLVIGDYVIGSNCAPKKVLGIFPQGTKPVFRVKTTTGRTTHCCDEHLWTVRNVNESQFQTLALSEIRNDLEYAGGVLKWELPILNSSTDTIASVTYYGEEECRCIFIESEDSLYVTDDYILTHNTFICTALSKYFNELGLTGLIIVPNVKLAKQTLESYVSCNIDAKIISDTIKSNDKRLAVFKEHKNVIITATLLNNLIKYADENCPDFFKEISMMILYDEVHIFGDTMFDAFKYSLATAPIRVGMSGTVPYKDKLKYAKICGSLGGGEIAKVSVKQLQDKGYASNFVIDFVTLIDQDVDALATRDMAKSGHWDWSKEERYYSMKKRAKPIVDYVNTLEPKNTLILCRPELGHAMAIELGTICIDKDVPNEKRDELFSQFAIKGTNVVVASFDTSATGISQNMIHRVVLVDAGKDETWVLQGIGRGIRLDGDTNVCEIVDISANTLYANEHRKERKKIYKREKFTTSGSGLTIRINDE
ncbi:hypothetical protein [Alishewanella phage vB_AspM_Slicko01]|nr:hypothetical protein [Alishewanella phage vB_AspM_Slicko01]